MISATTRILALGLGLGGAGAALLACAVTPRSSPASPAPPREVVPREAVPREAVRAGAGAELLAAAHRIARQVFATTRTTTMNYRLGLALEGLLDLADATGDGDLRARVLEATTRMGLTPAAVVPYRTQPFGCLTYALFKATDDRAWLPVFLSESEALRREIERSDEGAILHECGKSRGGGFALLIDAMQEYAARMARAGALTGDASYRRESSEQFRVYRELLRDPRTGLWSQGRGWLGDRPGDLSPGAWSRGHGWLMRGLIASLEVLPAGSKEFDEVRGVLRELAETLVPLQQPDGMWPTLLHRPAGESPRDTSGTAMIATGLARALRSGWLQDPAYGAAADRAFASLAAKVDPEGNVLGVSPGPGPLESEADYLAPSFPVGNDHGTFAVLFAAAEAARRPREDNQDTR